MILFDDRTADSLYRGVLAEPDNDLQRLVLADRLEEIGQAERAEFIRLQIEDQGGNPHRRLRQLFWRHRGNWHGELEKIGGAIDPDLGFICGNVVTESGPTLVIRRGFPAEVRAPLDWLRGGVCESCSYGFDNSPDAAPSALCRTCHGTRRTPGHLRELARKWPIQRVVVTDREPWQIGPDYPGLGAGWVWWIENEIDEVEERQLPAEVFGSLTGGQDGVDTEQTDDFGEPTPCRLYPTHGATMDALSDALLQEAREEPATP